MTQSVATDSLPAAQVSWRPRIAFGLIMGYFTLYGVVLGGQGVLWADLVLALGLSNTSFGVVQFISPLVTVTLMLLGSQLGARWGKKALAIASFIAVIAGLVGLGIAPNLLVLAFAMVLLGTGAGLTEIAMNGGAIDWEQATGRAAMNMFHASFSAGAVIGSSVAGALLGAGWSYRTVFVALAVAYSVLLVAALFVRYPPADDHGADGGGIGETVRVMRGNWALIGLAAIAALGVVGFTTSSLWQVIYLRGIGASAFVGGMALALFNTSMFAGRVLNAPFVTRFGAWTSLLVSGAGMFVSAVLLLLPGGVPMAVVAFMVLGISCAGTIPTALSVAARLSPGKSSAVSGGIMSAPYIVNMALPGLTGAIADNISLRVALLVVGVSGVGIMLIVRRITPSRRR